MNKQNRDKRIKTHQQVPGDSGSNKIIGRENKREFYLELWFTKMKRM